METLFGSFKEMVDEYFTLLEQQVLPAFESQIAIVRHYSQTDTLPFFNLLLFAVKGYENEDDVGVDVYVHFQYSDFGITDYQQAMEMVSRKEHVYYLVNCGQKKGIVLYGKIAMKDNPNFEVELKDAFVKICQCLEELSPFIVDEIQTCYLDSNNASESGNE